jgi:DNA modification methylase
VTERLTWVAGDRPEEELDETSRKILAAQSQSGTSIFDPVLCELAYRWFCPPGGSVLDPFAGGSVRGIVASVLGLDYTGIDLRSEQIAANDEQALRITPDCLPRWIVGDSREAATLAPGEYDLVFSCPPYADLERYSDDPADLSTMDYPAFLEAYRAIVAACVGMLRPDRFACFVVGDIRDRKGFYRNFVGDTIAALQDAGATLYNEAILITMVGSLPIRVGKQFASYRKLGKTHQNVIVGYKGDPRRIPDQFGEVEVGDPASEFGEVETE